MPTDTTLTCQTAGGELTLSALGARIEALHQAACGEARTAMEHALECGRLLLRAKVLTGHGTWLPWLQAHCTIGSRQAQRYMRLASHPEALAKCDSETYLPLSRALAQIAVPRAKDPPEQDLWEWAGAQLSAPFDHWDFEKGSFHWCTVKLLHHLKVPTLAAVWLAEADEFDLPLLRLCGYDELLEAVRRLAPAANGDAILPLADQRLRAMSDGANYLTLCASRALGVLLKELNHRQECSEQQYLCEYDEVLTHFREQCDQRLAELETAGKHLIPGEPENSP